MNVVKPIVGQWYRGSTNELFEVVAIDDEDETIEIQYFDGTIEEMDVEDWDTQWDEGALESAEAPEDWSGSVDVEATSEEGRVPAVSGEDRELRANSLEGIDLFE